MGGELLRLAGTSSSTAQIRAAELRFRHGPQNIRVFIGGGGAGPVCFNKHLPRPGRPPKKKTQGKKKKTPPPRHNQKESGIPECRDSPQHTKNNEQEKTP